MANRPAHYRPVNEDEEAPPPYALEGTAVPDSFSASGSSYPAMPSSHYPPMAPTAPSAPTASTALPPPPSFYPQYPVMAAPQASVLVPGLTAPPTAPRAVPPYPAMPVQSTTSRQYSMPYPAMGATMATSQPSQQYPSYQPRNPQVYVNGKSEPSTALSSSSSLPPPPVSSVPDLLDDDTSDVITETSTGLEAPEIVTSYKCRRCGQKLDSATAVCKRVHFPGVIHQENQIRRLTSPPMAEGEGDSGNPPDAAESGGIVISYKCRKCGQKLDSATSVCKRVHFPGVVHQENQIRRLTSPPVAEAEEHNVNLPVATSAILHSEHSAAPTAPYSRDAEVEKDLIDFGGDDDRSEDPFLSPEERMRNLKLVAQAAPPVAQVSPPVTAPESTPAAVPASVAAPAPAPAPVSAVGEMPGIVTAYKCSRCGHRLESESAVCKRLHTPSLIRQENHIRRSTAVSKAEIEGRNSTEEAGDGNHGTDSIYLRKNKSLRAEQRRLQQQTILPSDPSLSNESLVSSSGGSSSQLATMPPTVVAPPATHNGVYAGGDGNDGTSSIYLRRSISVQNPVTTLKKFWRDGKKEIQFQSNKRHSASQPREIVAPPPLLPSVQGVYAPMGHGYDPSGVIGRSNTYAGRGQWEQGHITPYHQQQQQMVEPIQHDEHHPAYNPALEQYDPPIDQIAPPPPPPEYAPEFLPRPSAPPRLPSWEPHNLDHQT